jgi:hypothetical protein
VGKKVFVFAIIGFLLYPPLKSKFFSMKFNKDFEEKVSISIEKIVNGTSAVEKTVEEWLLIEGPKYNVVTKGSPLTFWWAEDTLTVMVKYSIPINFYIYKFYPEYTHSFYVDFREIKKALEIKRKIEESPRIEE